MLTRSEALFATLCCRNHVCVRRTEWQSQLLGRYQRRTHRVDEAILGVYLAGANTRRIRLALAPLLRGGPLSKDAVSRLVGRLGRTSSPGGSTGGPTGSNLPIRRPDPHNWREPGAEKYTPRPTRRVPH